MELVWGGGLEARSRGGGGLQISLRKWESIKSTNYNARLQKILFRIMFLSLCTLIDFNNDGQKWILLFHISIKKVKFFLFLRDPRATRTRSVFLILKITDCTSLYLDRNINFAFFILWQCFLPKIYLNDCHLTHLFDNGRNQKLHWIHFQVKSIGFK